MKTDIHTPYGKSVVPRHDRMLRLFLEEIEGEGVTPAWRDDISMALGEYLELYLRQFFEAYALGIPGMFPDFLYWSCSLFEHHGMAPILLENINAAFEMVLEKTGETGSGHPLTFFKKERTPGKNGVGNDDRSYLDGDDALSEQRKIFFSRLLEGDRHGATKFVLRLAEQDTPVKEIYSGVFHPCLYEVGRLWQLNKISVAQEHYFSAVIQSSMSQLYPHIFSTRRVGHSLVATAVGGELHDIGIQMVSDFFEMEGWDTYYLGADCPIGAVFEEMRNRKAEVLALSVTMNQSLSTAKEIVRALADEPNLGHCRAIVGGKPFLQYPGLWEEIGADAWAPNAESAVRKAETLLGRGERPSV